MNVRFLSSFLLFVLLSFPVLRAADVVESPNGKIKADISFENQQLTYSVSYENKPVLTKSTLGVRTSLADFTSGLTYVSSSKRVLQETFQLPTGKRSTYLNHCNELEVVFTRNSRELHLIFRAYDDGIAYQYKVLGAGSVSFFGETSQFTVADFQQCWAGKYANSYEQYYAKRTWAETLTQGKLGAPVLVKNSVDSIFCLLTEAANTGTYTSSSLQGGSQTGAFNLLLNGTVTTSLPASTPWRVALIGPMTGLVESTMVENLNPATSLTDFSWIKPGKASWDWGGEEGGPAVSNALAEKYIDFSSSMGWEYYMQDDGWDKAGFDLQKVINYAKTKNVGVLLWSHSNRFTNNETQIRTILTAWKKMGIKGIKVDFWNDDSQIEFQKYDKLVKVAAEQELLVNVHGCTKPSGLRRTWPNLVTSEGVYGGEQYLFNGTATPATHNITLTMTRNIIGPMDYTPVDFAGRDGAIKQLTSWSHQLAMGIVFESGIQHMNDSPENYEYNPAKTFLKKLPVAWDETTCLEAFPDKYVTLVRRKGDEWYLGSLCDSARTLSVKLDFLENGQKYQAQIFQDGTCPTDINYVQKEFQKGDLFVLDIPAHGGVSVLFTMTPFEQPVFTLFEAEATGNTMASGARKVSGDLACSGSAFVGWLGSGANLTMNNVNAPVAGAYNLTVYYMSGETRNTYIKVNSGTENMIGFGSTGGYEGNRMGMKTVQVDLKQGGNTVKFGNASSWAINIDRVVISPIQKETTGLVQMTHPVQTEVYPGLTNGPLSLRFAQSASNARVNVLDAAGRVLFKTKSAQVNQGEVLRLDLSSFSDGLYLICIQTSQNSVTHKIIKKSL